MNKAMGADEGLRARERQRTYMMMPLSYDLGHVTLNPTTIVLGITARSESVNAARVQISGRER